MNKIFLSAIAYLLYVTFASAGSIQTNYQGQKQAGMGHTGTGLLLDNSAIFFNPGAVSFLDSLRGFSFSSNFIFARTAYLNPFPGNYTAQTEHRTASPFALYAVYKFKKTYKWNAGLGIYTPYGNKVQWKDDWQGQFIVRETNFKMLYIQPTFSYQLNQKWGLGLGLILADGKYRLRKALNIQDTAGVYGEEQLKGNARGTGLNVGIYFKANEKLSIGIDFRSAVNAAIKGNADFTVAPSLAAEYMNTKFSTHINLPQVISLGLGYALNSKLKFALDINYTGWGSQDSMIIDYVENTAKMTDSRTARMYDNSIALRIGAQCLLNTKWTIRLGSYYDRSPAKSGYFSPETLDADQLGISFGATFNVTKKAHVDASLIYIEGMKRSDTDLQSQFGGTYKTKAVVPGISFEYMF